MRKWFHPAIVGLLWLANFINGSGIDYTYHVMDRAKLLIIVATAVAVAAKVQGERTAVVKKSDFVAFGGMAAVFVLSSLIHGRKLQALDYLFVFLVVYLLSRLKFSDKDFQLIGLGCGAAGFGVLWIFNRARILSGWNDNTIAMVGFFSYLLFLIPLFNVKSKRSKYLVAATGLVFSILIFMTKSRSCIVFVTIALAYTLGLLNRRVFYRSNARINLLLYMPVLIAAASVIFASTSFAASVDRWSMLHLGKPFFNGRDEVWERGFRILAANPLIGNGNLLTFRWHNSGIYALAAYGLLGYYFWIRVFRTLLNKARPFLEDYLIQGCIVSFAMIYLQQTVELGFISATPNLLPYIILGMMLGRIRYLRTEQNESA